MKHAQITPRQLEDILVASLRFRGQAEEIASKFEQLRAAIGSHATGPGIVIEHDSTPETGHDLEVCVPVRTVVEGEKLTCRTLPGGPWLTITHIGPYEDTPATWRVLGAYIREHCVGIAEDPAREVYLEGPEIHGENTSRYVMELQVPLMLPRWIADLADGLDRLVGVEARTAVLGGANIFLTPSLREGESNPQDVENYFPGSASTDELIDIDADPARQVAWAQHLMQRLDAVVTDETIRYRIMNGCAHRFPQERIDFLRQKFQELGSIDALLDFMREDKSLGGRSFYAAPQREGTTIIETKQPARPQAYAEATNPREKRAAACFCPIVRQAILAEADLSATWCHCGAGWFTQLWGGILGHEVQVDVLETVRAGGERCVFRVHIPAGVPLD